MKKKIFTVFKFINDSFLNQKISGPGLAQARRFDRGWFDLIFTNGSTQKVFFFLQIRFKIKLGFLAKKNTQKLYFVESSQLGVQKTYALSEKCKI